MKSKTPEYGWIAYLQEKIQSFTSLDLSQISWAELLYMLGAVVGGFIGGMIFKKHGRSLCMFLCLTAIVLWAMTYLGIATVHLEKAKTLIGLPESATLSIAYELAIAYIKLHALPLGSLGFGLFLGYLFG